MKFCQECKMEVEVLVKLYTTRGKGSRQCCAPCHTHIMAQRQKKKHANLVDIKEIPTTIKASLT